MPSFPNNPDAGASQPDAPEWSIVVPAYNEEERLGQTLRAIEAYCAQAGFSFEILVVDDGSIDGTAALVERDFPAVRLLKNPGNRGKGYSVRAGLLAGRGECLLFSDADLSTPIDEMARFAEELRSGADMVIASRALSDSVIEQHQAWWREFSGRSFNRLVRLISGLPFHDTQCGFKAYRRAAARRIARLQRLEGWAFDVEQLHIARLLGLRVREVPVRWINSPASRIHFLRDSTRMLLDVIRIRSMRYDLSQAAAEQSESGQKG